MSIPHHRLALPVLAAAVAASPLAAQTERFTLTGREPAVHNLAGQVTVAAGSGNAVVVEVTRAGQDAGELRVSQSGDAVRVIYPGDRIVYGRMGAGSRSTLQVRRDGTLGSGLTGSRRVTIAGSGRGTRAHADVRVLVPAGRTVSVHQGVGEVQVTNVNGRVEVNTAAAGVRAQGTRGELSVDVGSGAVQVRDAQGEVTVETGSGRVTLENVRGTTLEVSTGSGGMTGRDLRVQTLQVAVGSGSIDLGGVHARDVEVETGSGAITLGLATDANLAVETGSGGVNITVPASFGAELDIDTGSGGIDVDLPVTNQRASRGSFTGRVGDGNGRVEIETGSGGVRIRRG
jgi:lia operon protein LiaG